MTSHLQTPTQTTHLRTAARERWRPLQGDEERSRATRVHGRECMCSRTCTQALEHAVRLGGTASGETRLRSPKEPRCSHAEAGRVQTAWACPAAAACGAGSSRAPSVLHSSDAPVIESNSACSWPPASWTCASEAAPGLESKANRVPCGVPSRRACSRWCGHRTRPSWATGRSRSPP